MSRHTILGRFGPDDDEVIPSSTDEVSTMLNLTPGGAKLAFGIGDVIADLHKNNLYPTEIGCDLMCLAAHVHAADTRLSRVTESQDTWTRQLRLVVPVSDPSRWTTAVPTLSAMLNFLTGDRWEVQFRSRPTGKAKLMDTRTPSTNAPSIERLSLFSGGLDSLVGAIDALGTGVKPLFISHAGDGATSNAQKACFAQVAQRFGLSEADRVRLWMAFPKNLVEGVRAEDSTRARSFLFFALAAFVGDGLEHEFVIHAPENGLIALNVPLDPLRLGALSTRTTHPFYIARWNEVLALVGIPGRVENQYRHRTKGEMVGECVEPGLLKATMASSLSCSSPTKGRWNAQGAEHCGYCTPCLIRLAATRKALGSGGDPTKYAVDLRSRVLNTARAEGRQVRSFQLAIERLRTRPEIAQWLIHKPGPLRDVRNEWADLAAVYSRGMHEVAEVLDDVEARPT